MVLLRVYGLGDYVSYDTVTIFDLETKDMHIKKRGSALLEIDLPSRLRNMKLFSDLNTPSNDGGTEDEMGLNRQRVRPKRLVKPHSRYISPDWTY